MTLDYTRGIQNPLSNADWIAKSPSTEAVTGAMTNRALAEIERRVAAGETSGTLTLEDHVATDGATDGDLYTALGKFALEGRFEFSVERGLLGLGEPRVRIESEFRASDRYDWDPPRKCGLLDHIVPHALEQQGRAESFDVEVRWPGASQELELP